MKKTLIFLFIVNTVLTAQLSSRYLESVFTYNQSVTNGVYATALELDSPYQGENFTHTEELTFHLFEPVNDTLQYRPMLIAIHGGAFVAGDKENEDMLDFCRIFAQHGYVTATIQYRLGMNAFNVSSSERAVYRGIQDGRAVIRYFRENAELYGIDTNKIYMIGSSAGAFIGLHNLYLNEESEIPLSAATTDPNLGGLDEINPALKHNSQANGLIALWGALRDTVLIKSTDPDVPIFLVHGTNDNVVPFDVGPPFGASFYPDTYGSNPISKRLINLGRSPQTYFVSDAGHVFYGSGATSGNEYWDSVLTKVNDFLYEAHKPTAQFTYENTSGIYTFSDQSVDAVSWYWDFGDSTYSYQQNPQHVYSESGNYEVTLLVQNDIASWDKVSTTINYNITGIDDNDLTYKFELNQNYPNPFNPTTSISYSIPQDGKVSIIVYDVLGHEIIKLVDEYKYAGKHTRTFNAENMSSGIYFYTLSTNNFIKSKKMILIK